MILNPPLNAGVFNYRKKKMIVEILKGFSKYNVGEKFHFAENEVEMLVKRGLAKIYTPEQAVEQKIKPATKKADDKDVKNT